jgi:hypothetical protein
VILAIRLREERGYIPTSSSTSRPDWNGLRPSAFADSSAQSLCGQGSSINCAKSACTRAGSVTMVNAERNTNDYESHEVLAHGDSYHTHTHTQQHTHNAFRVNSHISQTSLSLHQSANIHRLSFISRNYAFNTEVLPTFHCTRSTATAAFTYAHGKLRQNSASSGR